MTKKKDAPVKESQNPVKEGYSTFTDDQPGFPAPEEGIGERIRKRREELRLNYEELSRLTARCDYWGDKKGLTSAMIARYEKGAGGKPVLPGARELRILCDALNVEPSWLLNGVEQHDASDTAVELVRQMATLLKNIEGFEITDPRANSSAEWIWQQKLTEVKKP